MRGDFNDAGKIMISETSKILKFSTSKPETLAPPRVLVLTHSHPRLSRGGAEIAAATLVRGLRENFEVEAFLLGCSHKPVTERLGLSLTQPFASDDFVYQAPPSFDHFKFANRDPKFPNIVRQLLEELKPDIVHFHHYTTFGVEAFEIVRNARPHAKIVLTLHEFLAICHNHGQMVKKSSLHLCDNESPIACNSCFPTHGPRDFFLRKSYIQKFFRHIDLFISPSQFLADRYVDWGVARDKVIVLENVPPEVQSHHSSYRAQDNRASRFTSSGGMTGRRPIKIGYFGQMSPLKGVPVLLQAAKELAGNKINNLSIEIFGDYTNQPPDFQKAITDALTEVSSNVRYHGPYDNANVHRLMRSVDAVVVPSIWWENSPVVIQEALTNERPVICSDIGGMAEAIRDGVDGLWFNVGDSASLAQLLTEISQSPEILTKLGTTLRRPRPVTAVVEAHLEVYRQLREGVGAVSQASTNSAKR